MKKFTLPLVSLLCLSALTAQATDLTKMSSTMKMLTLQAHAGNRRAPAADGDKMQWVSAFVKTSNATVLEGYALCNQGDIYIVHAPLAFYDSLSDQAEVEYIETSLTMPHQHIDHSAPLLNVDQVWAGVDSQGTSYGPFDGTGVVVADVDGYHDYVHPAFRSAKDGHLRVVSTHDPYTLNPDSPFGFGKFYTDTAAIISAGSSSDAGWGTHGTMTTSMAAGADIFAGRYQGMAPEADIIMYGVPFDVAPAEMNLPNIMKFTDFNQAHTAYLFQKAFDTADELGKPCVINFSAGNPEPLTDEILYEQYLNRMLATPGHLLVASAGNFYNQARSMGYINDETTAIGGPISAASMQPFATSSATFDIMTNTPLKITLYWDDWMADDPDQQTQEFASFVFDPSDAGSFDSSQEFAFDSGFLADTLFVTATSANFESDLSDKAGWLNISSNHGYLQFGLYQVKFEALDTEQAGKQARIFSNWSTVLDNGSVGEGFNGTGGTIGSPASIGKVIAVGATGHTSHFTNWIGGEVDQSGMFGSEGEIARFSSAGPTKRMLTKPDVMAPGVLVAGAVSSRLDRSSVDQAVETVYTDANSDTWAWARMNGTSFSAPIVSGILALWLQADPTLTNDRVKQVIARTARHTAQGMEYPNNLYGHGEIDAYAGLLDVLGITTGIQDVSTRQAQGVQLSKQGSQLQVSLAQPASSAVAVRAYAVDGTVLAAATVPAGGSQVQLGITATGIVVVQVDGYGSKLVKM